MFRVLVTSRSFGQVSDEADRLLESAGCTVDRMVDGFDPVRFAQAIPGYDALIIGAHPFDAALFDRCSRLKLICKHGVGLDNIPLEAARSHGVAVTNAPGANADAVADFTMALMLACARNLVDSATALRAGNTRPIYGSDVAGKTLGLLGFGNISRRVARRAAGFGMTVIAYDPYVSEVPEDLSGVRLRSFEDVMSQSDYVSVHLPKTEETTGMLDAGALALMKPSARLINTSRGGILDEQALCDAVSSGCLAGAAIDVLECEPAPPDSPILSIPGVIVTNHVASYSYEALNAVSMICARNILHCLNGEPMQHCAW